MNSCSVKQTIACKLLVQQQNIELPQSYQLASEYKNVIYEFAKFTIVAITVVPLYMTENLSQERPSRWSANVYTCTDGAKVACRQDAIQVVDEYVSRSMRRWEKSMAPRNGIQLKRGVPRTVDAFGNVSTRNMTELLIGGVCKTYALPRTTITIHQEAFWRKFGLCGIRFNEGLKTVGPRTFSYTDIRQLVLSSSISKIEEQAFCDCSNMVRADLRAPRGLKALGNSAFDDCNKLEQVLLNDHLEKIGNNCFRNTGLSQFVAPPSLCEMGEWAFWGSQLKHADFSACLQSPKQQKSVFLGKGLFRHSQIESIVFPHALKVIGEDVFRDCAELKAITFDPDCVIQEIGRGAFCGSWLKQFVAPPSLRKIGDAAFAHCSFMKDFQLNDGTRDIGYFCLLKTKISNLKLPSCLEVTLEHLGLSWNPKELCLPKGLEQVGEQWFDETEVEKVVIPSSVKVLGVEAFYRCHKLKDIVFERGSRLKSIERSCFYECAIENVCIPKSVQRIGRYAFNSSQNLSSLVFEEGSKLNYVGPCAFENTKLTPEQLKYPNNVKEDWK